MLEKRLYSLGPLSLALTFFHTKHLIRRHTDKIVMIEKYKNNIITNPKE